MQLLKVNFGFGLGLMHETITVVFYSRRRLTVMPNIIVCLFIKCVPIIFIKHCHVGVKVNWSFCYERTCLELFVIVISSVTYSYMRIPRELTQLSENLQLHLVRPKAGNYVTS